jgi:hypothetical protein
MEKNKADKTLGLGRSKPFHADQGGESFFVDVWDEKGRRPAETSFYRRKLGHLTLEEQAETSTPISDSALIFLNPGETRTDRIDVRRLYDLSRPGKYTIQVKLPTPSNKLVVIIVP